ncbi:hypothetical protein EYF80_066081 [Liparis tanakae]|uniref:Uncharacterized protein n=1 Tax=Liparis tanakae TaxID=230148 RepID=A0A4Z2E4V7_9TELE|nr:hypothetical protein EYF80_066081 [Liparis tanakae]
MPGTRGEGPGGRGVGSAPCWAPGQAVRQAAAPRALDTVTGPPANGELAQLVFRGEPACESSSPRRQPSDCWCRDGNTKGRSQGKEPREGTKGRNQGKESGSLGFPADVCDVITFSIRPLHNTRGKMQA